MKKKKYIYCDMDGVLADFDGQPNALSRFREEKGFFANLEPIQNNVDALKKLINNKDYSVRILSASPNEQADKDKKIWLKKFLPELKNKNIIIMRVGRNKSDYIQTNDGILLDDFGANCEQWQARGRVAYKISAEKSIAYYLF